MDVYIYRGALLCEDCGEKTRTRLSARGDAPANPDDESSFDSNSFPAGPSANGGGEADQPQHCDRCGVFLENPLSADGRAYVRNARQNLTNTGVVRMWVEFYGISDEPEDGSSAF